MQVTTDSAMKRTLGEIDKVNAELRRLGVDTKEFEEAVGRVMLYLDKPLTIRNYFVNQFEYEFHEYNRRVMEWNATVETVAEKLERAQVRITNEYRVMLGRRAVVIDDRLVTSARGHSEEMGRLGYFSHFSPIPERRTPDRAHYGWVHSSGHHRNLLRRFWTEMGTGRAGNIWTQNFGRTKPKVFDAPDEENK
jgi:uncharacterized protein YkwD